MSGNAFTKAAPKFYARPFSKLDLMGIRFADGDGGDGGGAGGDGGADGDDKPKTFTQADIDRITGQARIDERKKYPDYDKLKADSAAFAEAKKNGLTPEQKAIDEALEKGRNEGRAEVNTVLQRERAQTAVGTALEGRTLNTPTALIGLDLNQFLKDGKVDADGLKTWVDTNTTETPKQGQKKDPAQGGRDSTAGSGSVQSGREAFEARRNKNSKSS